MSYCSSDLSAFIVKFWQEQHAIHFQGTALNGSTKIVSNLIVIVGYPRVLSLLLTHADAFFLSLKRSKIHSMKTLTCFCKSSYNEKILSLITLLCEVSDANPLIE